MGLLDAVLPKQYKNARTLYESDLDAWRKETEALLNTANLNLLQIGKDVYGTGYEFNNNGSQTESTTIEQYITNIINGSAPINGTSSDEFRVNSDAEEWISLSNEGTDAAIGTGVGSILINSGLKVLTQAVTADVNSSKTSMYFGCDTLAADTVTILTTHIEDGRMFIIQDEGGDASTYNITIATEGAELISGGATAVICEDYGSITLIVRGDDLYIV